MPEPFNYSGMIGAIPSAFDSFGSGVQAAQVQQQNDNALAKQQQALQIAQQREQQYQTALQAALDKPSPRSFANLALINPDAHEAIKKGWDILDTDVKQTALRDLSGVYGFAINGDKEGARRLIQNHIDADKRAGLDTSQYDSMIGLLDEEGGLKKVAGISGILLSSAVPDKFAETFKNVGEDERADALNPALVDKGIADAAKATVEAEMAPQVIASDLASEAATRERQAAQTRIEQDANILRGEELGLARDTLMTNTQLKLDELRQTGQAVTGASLEELTKSVTESQTSQALAARANKLADGFAALPAGSGSGSLSSLNELLKSNFGMQGGVTQLRGEYEQIKNAQAVKNLPPGPASDKDIQLAQRGFPPATADRDYIVSFLRGMAKMQNVAASAADRKADWISMNGNLGTAKRDLDVAGVRVPAGTTFGEFNRNAVKVGNRGQAPVRGYLEKYGK